MAAGSWWLILGFAPTTPVGERTLMMGLVAQRDPAFLWETEALRTTPHAATPTRHQEPVPSHGDWLTLREANELTGVPVATLRKWARRESVPSYLEETAAGQLRMVSLQGIYRRAEELGREVERGSQVIDLTRGEEVGSVTKPEVAEGTMLVPLDAWNKMLNQLGNLHEAGQQLAEARERAAKAETEATFLRERLAEMRAELARARADSEAEQQPARNASPSVSPSTWTVLRDLVAGWSRSRKS